MGTSLKEAVPVHCYDTHPEQTYGHHHVPATYVRRLVVAPNGVAYASSDTRPGVLPRLLSEILNTRVMVKDAMKRAPKAGKVEEIDEVPVLW